jgi:deoxyribodipyrimidine photo-lyase
MLHIVWFKRDLRVTDHAPLLAAAAAVAGDGHALLPLVLHEPERLAAPDHAPQHDGFAAECLAELARDLGALGSRLVERHGEALAVFESLRRRHGIAALWSHEEIGNARTYARDRRVAAWARAHGIAWHEFPRDGVVRRLRDRDTWSHLWMRRMSPDPLAAPKALPPPPPEIDSETAAMHSPLGDKPARQRGGRRRAEALLDSFLAHRGTHYRTAMSAPSSAASACSRLSPHFAFGTLSIREAAHALWTRRRVLSALEPGQCPEPLLASLKSFESRLHWHCHFIQKLESEPAIEFQNMHRGYDGLRDEERPSGPAAARLAAWCRGETGYPLIDACMRYLACTGWLNFRMRAMLVSFASYQLWLHWKEPAHHLAREFLDYEPGIHYAQMQMQSGVTGINAIRLHDPVKQARDHDPHGAFVRRWLPELARLPPAWLFEPWTAPPDVQRVSGCRIGIDHPCPIVDHEATARIALTRMHQHRADVSIQAMASQVWLRHGSRNPAREGRPQRPRRTPASPNLSLF